MSLLVGAGDFGIGPLVAAAQNAQAAAEQAKEDAGELKQGAEAAKEAAINAAKSIVDGIDLGPWNVATNTPTLTASSSSIPEKGYYYVSVSGNAPFAGNNFASGAAFSVGDRLVRLGASWYRRQYTTQVTPQSVGESELKNDSVTRQKLDAVLRAYYDLMDMLYPKGYGDNLPYAYVKMDAEGRIGFFLDLAGRLGTPLVPDLGGTLAEIRDRTYQWPDESGYVYGKADTNGRIAYGIDSRGVFLIRGRSPIEELDTINARTVEWPDESGYIYAKVDQNGRILYGFNRAGELTLKGVSIYELFAPKSIVQLVQSVRDVACWGDSLTEMGWPALLANLLNDGRSVYNGGVSGDTSTQIAFRQGGLCMEIQVSGNEIPASGGVSVIPTNLSILNINRPLVGTLFGIPGTLVRTDMAGSYTFTRSTAGIAIKTDKTVLFGAVGHPYKTTVIWAGRNNYASPAIVLADIAAMVAYLKPSGKQFVILSILNGSYAGESIGGAGYEKIVNQINGVLRRTYPRNYLDVRELLIRNYNPSIPQDVTDYNNDVVPSSLRVDELHINATARTLVAQYLKDFFIQNNY